MTAKLTRIDASFAASYEACNFQDIAGQRIGKVIETLSIVDSHLARSNRNGVVHEAAAGQPHHSGRLLNGPRPDGEAGSVSQQNIDAMFS